MKLVGIVGSIAEFSHNRQLLQYMADKFKNIVDIDVMEIKDIPLFNQDEDWIDSEPLKTLIHKIRQADGVIIATPEHNHTITSALKSTIEWLSCKVHPLDNKPVMVVGASYYDQGSSRAQLHLRQILDAPGVNALLMPGNEFLLGEVKEAFDRNGRLKDQGTINFLESTLYKFIQFVNVVQVLDAPEKPEPEPEDLHATGSIDTTIMGVDKSADDWVERAAEKIGAVEGDTYVKLDRGILTVDQLNDFLRSMPLELTFADSNNQFLYYNNEGAEAEDMLAGRHPGQVGNPLVNCHPEAALKNVEWVIQQLRSGEMDVVRVHVPTHGPDKFVVHNYQAMHDKEGNYTGINEHVHDIQPLIDWYLDQTGQTLVGGVDATSGASANADEVDATSSASKKEEQPKVEVDTVSSASVKS